MAAIGATTSAVPPQVVFVPPGSVQLPHGFRADGGAAAAAPTPPAPPAGTQPASSAPPPPVVAPTGTGPGPQAAVSTTGATAARAGASLLGKVMALIPIAAGATQMIVGLLITRGTIPITAAPLIGAVPKFVIGGLVAATATPTLLGGFARLLGKA